jgi:hypothetical protein
MMHIILYLDTSVKRQSILVDRHRFDDAVAVKSGVLVGLSLGARRFIWWNVVSSSKERIEQAKADWEADRMGRIPGETERIPLPER